MKSFLLGAITGPLVLVLIGALVLVLGPAYHAAINYLIGTTMHSREAVIGGAAQLVGVGILTGFGSAFLWRVVRG